MSKVSTLCIISLLLFLTLSFAVGRPVAIFDDVTPMETHHVHDVNNHVEKLDKEESCEGLGEDDCMMRRTLEAHLDYIYTQKQKQP